MTEGFDKEIDAILRKMRNAEKVLAATGAVSTHLDADALAAFAENALPENTKIFYTKHLADCDRCRKILADSILPNSLTKAEAVSTENKTEDFKTAFPWYRRFFVLPKAAYALAALVLVFGGFLGFLTLQNFQQAEVSRAVPEMSPPIGQHAESANTLPVSANVANVPLNTNLATVSSTLSDANKSMNTPLSNANAARETSVREKESKKSEKEATITTLPQATPTAETKAADESTVGSLVSTPAANARPTEDAVQTQSRETLPHEAKKMKAPAQKAETSGEENAEKTSIGGKTFTKRNNVWVDSEYRNQATVNISRGSGEYQNLDSKLRRIVEKLSGTVIVIWQGKAYRIQ